LAGSNFQEMPLKPSFYNLFFENDGRSIIFNTLTSAITELNADVLRCIRDNNIGTLNEETIGMLENMGVIVDDDYNELQEYLGHYERSKDQDGRIHAKLMLSTSCNLCCTYCYQNAAENPTNIMGDSAIRAFILWTENQFVNDTNVRELAIELYGGEPLLARVRLPSLFKELNRLSDLYSIPVSYAIVTNGTLIDDLLIDIFVDNRVDMQITLDGDKETHDSRRRWKSGAGTYEQIITSIRKILARGGSDLLQVRMNIDANNLPKVSVLANELKTIGVKRFHCGWIHFREKAMPYSEHIINTFDLDSKFDVELYKVLNPLGYAHSPCDLERKMTCMFHWKNGFVFTPSMDVFKCDELIEQKEHCIGHVDNDGEMALDRSTYDKFISRKPTDFTDCPSCRYLPQCGSGCPIKSLHSKGDLHSNYCETSCESVFRKVNNYINAVRFHGVGFD